LSPYWKIGLLIRRSGRFKLPFLQVLNHLPVTLKIKSLVRGRLKAAKKILHETEIKAEDLDATIQAMKQTRESLQKKRRQ